MAAAADLLWWLPGPSHVAAGHKGDMFAEWRWGVARANRWATYGRKYDQHLVRVLIVGGLAGDSGKGPCSVANEPRPLHVWVDAILCNSVMFESYGFFCYGIS